jgi:hypothetical protein
LGGEVDGRIEGIVAGLSRQMMGIQKKKEKKRGVVVCLIPLGVEQSWQGDFLFLAQLFVDALWGGKSQRDRRIVLKIDRIISDYSIRMASPVVWWCSLAVAPCFAYSP